MGLRMNGKRAITVFLLLFLLICHSDDTAAYRYLDEEDGHDFILIGLGVFRQNFTSVEGDKIGFEDGDEGLPADYSNRSRVSLYGEGMVFNDYEFELNVQYNEEYYSEEDLTFFLKAERDENYLILGDHRDNSFEETVFTELDRKMRGATFHIESEGASATVLGGVLKGESATDEIESDGTSGPYRLENAPVVHHSERVEIQIRDRNDSDRIIRVESQTRGVDYSIDYDDGEIRFGAPVDRSDFRGNPVYVVVAYQYESIDGLYNRSVWGSRFTAEPFDPVRLGASWLSEGPWQKNVVDTWDERRQILGTDAVFNLANRYRIGVEVARSDVPQTEASYEADALRVNLDANPSDPLKVYGRYWKVEPEFHTFGNADLDSGTVFDDVETGKPFDFQSATLSLDLDPNIDENLGTDEESAGISATYEITDHNAVSAGFRETENNVSNDPLYPSDTERKAFASYKRIHPETTDFLLGAESIERFDDGSPGETDSRETRLVAGVKHPLGYYRRFGDINLAGAYQFEDFEDDVNDSNSSITHDVVGRIESVPRQNLMFFFEQAEQWVYDKSANAYATRTDTSVLGVDGDLTDKIELDATARYRAKHDLVENRVDEVEQIYTLWLDTRPVDTLRTGFRAEYRNIEYRPEDEREERIILGGDVRWNVRADFTARVRYDYEIEKTTFGGESVYDDFLIKLNYKRKNRLSVFGYYRLEHDRIEDDPFEETKSTATTMLLGSKYKFTEKIDMTAAYRIKYLDSDADDRREKYFIEAGYWFTRYFQTVVGYEHFKYVNEEDGDADYEADVGYISLVVKL